MIRGVIGDVLWTTPGLTSADSLPLGNGNIAANVWTEPSGDVLLYLAKNDAWDHLGRLIKVGQLRLRFTPGLTAPGGRFEQRLSLADASVIVTNGDLSVRLWIDAHWPRLMIEASAATPCDIAASLEPWRDAARELGEKEAHSVFGLDGGPVKLVAQPDQLASDDPHAVIWYQRNESSIWALSLDQQGLTDFKSKSTDPLLHRTFGGHLSGGGFSRRDERTLVSPGKVKSATLVVTAHAAQVPAAAEWIEQVRAQAHAPAPSVAELWRDHTHWWKEFWDRSHIRLRSPAPDWGQAEMISQQHSWQRYLVACCSRGLYPLKFNGGLFTADWGLKDEAFGADYRRWGGAYWWQNTRLPYSATLVSGDYDLLRPLFRMYRDMLPLAEQRTRSWFGHGGVFFPETLYSWGTYLPSNYGWKREGRRISDVENRYIGRLYISGLELVALMLDTYAHTHDAALLGNELLPIARGVLEFYAQHYPNGDDGKLRIAPAQSLETWWEAENPLPDIAGLHAVLPRLLALPAGTLTDGEIATWRTLLARLPAVPVKQTDGHEQFVPAEKHEAVPNNTENAELYTLYPFRLCGVGRPNLSTARWTFTRRYFPDTGGWRQDALNAALLGLTETAAFYVAKNCCDGNFLPARFKGFWGPNYDWVPDFDHGSVTQLALQAMLVQAVDRKIYLFPAWPSERWDVTFKVHAPGQTILEGELKDGKLVHLAVTPEERRKDVVVLLGENRALLAD